MIRRWSLSAAVGRAGLAATCIFSALSLTAGAQQKPQARITADVVNSDRSVIQGSVLPRARADNDAGKVSGDMKLQGMSFVFSRSDAQTAALDTLIAAQQNPSSALYHQWLTPDQFASRFGTSDADIAKVEGWLQQEGFTVDGVSRSRDRITFSGTAAQVEAAFGAPIHYFTVNGEKHFAPLGSLSVPAAFSASVLSIGNVSNFRPKPHVKVMSPETVKANFTSSQTQSHFVTPKDVATIYDINAAYNAGYTGTNQSIAIVGQSPIVLTDISNFQTAAGLTVKVPTTVLVPNSGTSTTPVTGDEGESDLDLEYAGGIARGASIYFVYTGGAQNYGVFDSLQYAIDQKLAPIISSSYGECETALGAADYASLNAILQQAATQGQTVIAAAGDDGSTDCYEQTGLTSAQQLALGVDFPASSQYVTGMGGTEYLAADVAVGNTTFWTAASGSDVISSALSYIPEMVWNDDSTSGISSGGGGISQFTPRPSWQTGVPGISSGSFRLVPDISLAASPNNAGYLYCSSDTKSTGITGSCSNGFRDSSNTNLTVAGGTSFAAPIFAGMLAIINQSRNSNGQGVINSTLYALASNPTTYANAFHDTTTGGNQCTALSSGTTVYCNSTGASAYAATTGYDEASGLGSVDLNNLLTAWPTSSTTVSAATPSPAGGVSDVITITVAPLSSTATTTPTGTVAISVDGISATSSLALSNGVATYTFSSNSSGTHVVQAVYSGDSSYSSSTGSISLSVGTTVPKTISISAPSLTVAAGTTGTSVVTVTPAGGYTGTIGWTLSTSASLSNACYTINSLAVTGTASVTTTLTVATSSTLCAGSSVVGGTGVRKLGNGQTAESQVPSPALPRSVPVATAFAGLVAFGWLGRRKRGLRLLLALVSLGVLGFGVSGCGGSNSSTTTATTSINATKGTYTLTLVGTDTTNATITASSTFTLTID